jgi:putative membrane protein
MQNMGMQVLVGAGKGLLMVFWAMVGLNLSAPFAHPFASLISGLAISALALHSLELLLFHGRLRALPRPRVARLQVLVFGVFHVLTLPAKADAPLEVSHA